MNNGSVESTYRGTMATPLAASRPIAPNQAARPSISGGSDPSFVTTSRTANPSSPITSFLENEPANNTNGTDDAFSVGANLDGQPDYTSNPTPDYEPPRRRKKEWLRIAGTLTLLFLLLSGWVAAAFFYHPKQAVTPGTSPSQTQLFTTSAGQILNVNGSLKVVEATELNDLLVDGQAHMLKDLAVDGNLSVGGNGNFGGTVTAKNFVGDGSQLSNLPIPSVPSNIVLLSPSKAQEGNINVTGVIAAGGMQGNGANITGLNADNIASGTLSDSRLSSNVAFLNRDNSFSGNVSAPSFTQDGNAVCDSSNNCGFGGGGAGSFVQGGNTFGAAANLGTNDNFSLNLRTNGVTRFTLDTGGNSNLTGTATAGAFSGNGSALTSLNASNLSSGTVSDARLSNNVPLKGGANTFTALNNFTGGLQTNGNTVCDTSGNCAASGGAGGDLTGTYPNPTIAKLQGATLTIAGLASGNFLRYNGSAWVNQSLSGDVLADGAGVTSIQANSVALSTDTTGNYVGNLGTLTGLTTSGNSGEGSTPSLSVTYGNLANTAVQGNVTLNCPSGTGNLSGGGNTIALGTGGSCSNLSTINNPTFTTSITTPQLILTGAGSNGTLQVANLGQSTTYTLPDPGGATATLCLTTGNCAGLGGGITGSGTSGAIAKFTGAATIGDSLLSESGSTVTVGGTLGVNTITPTASFTVGVSGQAMTLQGNASSVFKATSGGFTTTLGFDVPTANVSINMPALAAGSYNFCTTSGNCVGGGGGGAPNSAAYLTIGNNATLTNERAIAVNVTNLQVTDGGANGSYTINTIQDIATTSSPVFAAATLSNASSLTLGQASTNTGSILFKGSGSANTLTLQGPTSPTTNTLTLPNETGTLCSSASVCSGYAAAGNYFVQGGNSFSATATLGTNDSNSLVLRTNSTTALTIDTSQNTTFSGNVVVAASKSLTVTGGNTASRPGSPTEGMVYYDTTTKQLLTYANGKWQADRAAVTKIVAASNSSQAAKDAADYIATGTGDQGVINTALTAAAGGKVYLMEGTYVANATILIPNNTTLAGAGRGTLIELADLDATDNLVENSDTSTGTGIAIQDLRLDGRNDLNTAGTQYLIFLNGMGDGTGASARQGGKITNVIVNRGRTAGIRLSNSENNTLTGNTLTGNTGLSGTGNGGGFELASGSNNNTLTGNTAQGNADGFYSSSSTGNTLTGNTAQGNTKDGFNIQSNNNTISGNTAVGNGSGSGSGFDITGDNNSISSNTAQGNAQRGFVINNASNNNTLTGNMAQGNSNQGFLLFGANVTNNTLTGNTSQGNTGEGIYLISANNNTLTGNTSRGNSYNFVLSGSSNNTLTGNTANSSSLYGIQLVSSSNNNAIVGNKLHDNGGNSFASIFLDASDGNTISSNDITDTSGGGSSYAINISNSTSDNNILDGNRYSGTGATTINDAGTGTVYAVQSRAANGGQLTVRTANDTAAFAIQNASGNELLTVDTTNSQIVLGKASTLDGKLKFTSASGTGSISVVPANPGSSAFTLTLPAETGILCSTASVCAGYLGAPASGSYLKQVPTTTADNTISPTANSVVGLTVNGTSGTAATALSVAQGGNADALTISSSGTGNLLKVTDSTATARDVMTIADGGAVTFRNQTNTASAFVIQNSAASASLMDVNTSNRFITWGDASNSSNEVHTRIKGEVIINTSDSSALKVSTFTNNSLFWAAADVRKVGVRIGSSGDLVGAFNVNTDAANVVGQVIKGFTSQSADLLQAQDSSGAVLAKISASGDLTVKNATFNGTLTVNGHVITGNTSGSTTVAAGTAACTTPTVNISGNDTSGTITVTTGTGCSGTGVLATVTFANAYGSAPKVILTPADANGSNLKYYRGSSTTTFTLNTNTTPTDATTYNYDYHVEQ